MEDSNSSLGCPRAEVPRDRVSDDTNAGNSPAGSPGNESASSQSFVTDITTSDNTAHDSTPESATLGNRPRTKRGRNGKKWVGLNWEHKEHLKQQNGGVMPYSEALITSPFPHSDEWSESNLPEILFYIKPPKSEFEGQPVGFVKEDGATVKVGERNKPLRDFSILPRRISLEVPGWLVETWRRIDPRITYPDILDRQIEDPKLGLKKLDKNALQNHCRRECRMILGLWTSYERREVPHRTDVEAIECLSHQNVLLNTILNVSPDRQDRLTKLCLARGGTDRCGKYYAKPCEVTAANWDDTTFRLDHFVLKTEIPSNELHPMDTSMLAAWELSLILQERARIHGVSHWKKLADACRPVSWFDRTANKRVENGTFDGGCSVCTWDPTRDQEMHKSWIDEMKSACSKPVNRTSTTKASSSSTSKRRKVNIGQSQNVSTDVVVESAKGCDCCKEADSSQDPDSPNEQYPSEQFRRGEIKSYFRDADCVEDAQVDNVMEDTEKHSVRNEEVEHNSIGWNAEHSIEPGTGADRESQLTTAHGDPSASSQDSSSQLMPTPNTDVYPVFDDFSAEKTLNGIGSHLMIGGGEPLLQHAQDEAAAASIEDKDDPFDPWMPPHKELPQGFSGNSAGDESYAAHRDAPIEASSSQVESNPFPLEELEDVTPKDGDWHKLHAQYATNLDAAPYLPMQIDQQGLFPFGDLDQTIPQQHNNPLLGQSQLSSFGDRQLSQGMEHGSWGYLPSLRPAAGVPGLASSFQTESGSLESEIPGLDISAGNNHGNFGMVSEPVNTFQIDAVGLSAVNDDGPVTGSRNKGKGVVREIDSDSIRDEHFHTKSFQERLEPPSKAAAPNVSGGLLYEGYNSSAEFPMLQTDDHYYADDDELLADDVSTFNFYSY